MRIIRCSYLARSLRLPCLSGPAQHDFSLRPKTIVLALDEGLEEDAIREEAAKLVQNNLILTTRVGYVWDPDHDIIPAGSKQNPADLGRDAYVSCLQTKVRWL